MNENEMKQSVIFNIFRKTNPGQDRRWTMQTLDPRNVWI